jgi:c-di-GMP-binding flagellar brake protein YcgR
MTNERLEKEFVERRACRRYSVVVEVQYRVTCTQPNPPVCRARTLNISNSGLLLESETPLGTNVDVELRIACPGTVDTTRRVFLQIKGKTVRVQEKYSAIRIEHGTFEIQPIQQPPFPPSS